MKTEQIKQMAEAKALEKYPKSSNAFIDKLCRGAYAEAIIDNYKEPERVNEKLLEALAMCIENTEDWQCKSWTREIDELILSASQQQENNDGWISVEDIGALKDNDLVTFARIEDENIVCYSMTDFFKNIKDQSFSMMYTHYNVLPNPPKKK